MTVGIGVLCCSNAELKSGERPDTIVMISDTLGSTECDSTAELRKLYSVPDVQLYAVCAGKMETAGEIVSAIVERLPHLPSRSYGQMWKLLNEVVNGHRAERFRFDVVAPRYELVPGKIQIQDHNDVVREFQEYNSGADLLVGTFDERGMAVLYDVGKMNDGSSALVRPVLFPGYYAIGTGAWNAQSWLNYRGQRLNFGVKRSALHAYEASQMAAAAPTVNENVDVVIATAKQTFLLGHDLPPPPGTPLTVADLKRMAKRYGPRSTRSL
jgi:hypothetical protein